MPNRARRESNLCVVLASHEPEVAALLLAAPELELVVVGPSELARRAVDLRARVAVWAVDDAPAGLRSLAAIRAAHAGARLLLVTAPDAEHERIAALEAGVDEVVSRPLSAPELAARTRALLRRSRPARRRRLVVGDGVALDLDRRELLRDDRWIHLRPKEAQLLELFARNPGRTLAREQILERVWGAGHDGDPRTVDVHVRWLRDKIEPDPHVPVRLLTVRGRGYRLEPGPLTER